MSPTHQPTTTGWSNRLVVRILSSPMHQLLSKWLCVVRYRGRRTGRRFATPTQYVRDGNTIVVLVGRAGSKTWWRNFTGEEHEVEMLVKGSWQVATGRAVVGAEDAAAAAALLTTFTARYPRAAKAIPGSSPEEKARNAVFVVAEPT